MNRKQVLAIHNLELAFHELKRAGLGLVWLGGDTICAVDKDKLDELKANPEEPYTSKWSIWMALSVAGGYHHNLQNNPFIEK